MIRRDKLLSLVVNVVVFINDNVGQLVGEDNLELLSSARPLQDRQYGFRTNNKPAHDTTGRFII
ncbi:MAG: hypothetical protein ACI35Y_05495 [Candidatus Limimorpha sp.]